jgi:general stress protein 26
MSQITQTQRIEKDEHLTGDAAIAKVRKLLPSFRAAIFVTGVASGKELHSRPLALQGDPAIFGGSLWFFADDRSPKIHELAVDTTVTLFFQNDSDNRYLQLDGRASLSKDKVKMRELYTPILKTWFPEGLDDAHLTLIRFDATRGTYWESPGGVLQFAAAFATSIVTGKPGKSSNSGTLSFS